MAKRLNLKAGDSMVVRWKTTAGAIDAHDLHIVSIFETEAPAIDIGQIWIPLAKMQNFLEATNHASIIVSKTELNMEPPPNWNLKDADDLLADTRKMIAAKKGGGSFLYAILMFLAMISLLDTQILSIFRRRKEVGLFLALGLTQRQVMGLFTIEGTLQGILAAVIAGVVGGPIFYYVQNYGIRLIDMSQFGMAGSDALFPYFGISLIVSTFTIIMLATMVVSYWPARKISQLSPTQAMRGNWT
jgi:ABC-type lipoprotein release transport system permease subunit